MLDEGANEIESVGLTVDYLEARHADSLAKVETLKDGPIRLLGRGAARRDAIDRQRRGVARPAQAWPVAAGFSRCYVRAELLYKHPNGFYAGPNVEWVPQAYVVDNANSVKTAPYALLNFRVGYDRTDGWSAYLEGRNLFDKKYIASTSIAETANAASALFEPGTGRAVFGVRYRK